MAGFPVRYRGSIAELHGLTFTATVHDCDDDHGQDITARDEGCHTLVDETGRSLAHVRRSSITPIAPDGHDLHRAARDGDWIFLPNLGEVRFAYQESGPTRRTRWIHYYACSGRRWGIFARLVSIYDAAAIRTRYTTPQERLTWQLRMALDELAETYAHPHLRQAFEEHADLVERLTQQQELNAAAVTDAPELAGIVAGQGW
ncbi:hypothetical protein [Streptomyces sp. CB01881]|uniref:hypothetical protein n=1 Tax=Streptomyces sp. CB01881 TaxID=2078691 RepID=UPI000CDC2A49|nr:hypothetical protein [Streptomyces sp. CB01881]AUY50428.1 hypothetical protein C2142_17495 [Streptomyces sp. CB01881]TYC73815.1 hypothetical protein EH183_17475 [Streptomyces sp. CB01881]